MALPSPSLQPAVRHVEDRARERAREAARLHRHVRRATAARRPPRIRHHEVCFSAPVLLDSLRPRGSSRRLRLRLESESHARASRTRIQTQTHLTRSRSFPSLRVPLFPRALPPTDAQSPTPTDALSWCVAASCASTVSCARRPRSSCLGLQSTPRVVNIRVRARVQCQIAISLNPYFRVVFPRAPWNTYEYIISLTPR